MGRGTWKRVVLKVSGEALASEAADEVINVPVVERLAKEIADGRAEFGTEIAVVIGGGNIWRGAVGSAAGMDRATADYMGMLATVINALALRDALEREGQETRVQTAIGMSEIAEPYIRLRAIRHLEKGRAVIFAAGTGNPFFTTDTAGALRAVEIGAEVLLKGTHGGVGAVYTADPRLDPTAVEIPEIGYSAVLDKDLRAIDLTAITLCKENALPILFFSIMEEGNLGRALGGGQIGTLIH
ncbi:MAG TPA: UMP kinase [Acidimicrobiales bacterium]|nr:UMP kinase [Acidimicrobiales bacterium]